MTTRGDEPPPEGRGATGAALVVAAALLVLVVAAAVGSERTDLGEGRSPVVGQILGGVIVGGFGAMCLIGAWLLLFRRGAARVPRRPGGPVVPWWLRSIVMIGLLVIAVAVGLLIFGDRPPSEEDDRATTASEEEVSSENGGGPEEEPEPLSGAFYAGVALAIVVVLVGAARARRGIVVEGEDDELEEDEEPFAAPLKAAADASLDALLGERDPRRAVVAAYARVQALLADQGLPRRPSETEPEYLVRVLRHYGAAAEPARRLTQLFELARYGAGPVDERMRSEAIDAAHALRDSAVARSGSP